MRGCLALSKGRKMLDLTGRKFGRLTVKGEQITILPMLYVNVSAVTPLQLGQGA